jgi:hypothetical protein
VAQRVPGSLDSQISWHLAREGGEVVSLTHRPPLSPGMFLVVIFIRGWVDHRALERSEEDMSLKNPVTPPGIDSRTVRLVAQPLFFMYFQIYIIISRQHTCFIRVDYSTSQQFYYWEGTNGVVDMRYLPE